MTDIPVPLVPEMIHRPDAPTHMMRILPVRRRVTVRMGGRELAASDAGLRVIEIGRDVHDPVLYLPRTDVSAPLEATAKSTHCPLKGDTTYYDLGGELGSELGSEIAASGIAWSYTSPLPFAARLADLVAFDPSRVTIEEGPLEG